jgi:UDP-galactose transporter B1
MATPVNRTASEEKQQANGHSRRLSDAVHSAEEKKGGYLLLIICVGGIYASL